MTEVIGQDGEPVVSAGLHEVLLHLAGRVPDSVLTTARALLAEGWADMAAAAVADAAVEGAAELTARHVELLARSGAPADVLQGVTVSEDDPALHWRFLTDLPGADPDVAAGPRGGGTRATAALLQALAQDGDAFSVWVAWRLPFLGPTDPAEAVQVHLVDLAAAPEGLDPAALAGRLQAALAGAGVHDPQVEVLPSALDLSSYQRLARAYGRLVAEPAGRPTVQVARTYDGVDEFGAAFMEPDHPVLDDDAERDRLLAHLRAGTVVMSSPTVLPDVLDLDGEPDIPNVFRTDGTWVWHEVVVRHVERWRLAPDEGLRQHVAAHHDLPAPVDAAGVQRAVDALLSSRT